MAKYLIKYESSIATGSQSVLYNLTVLNISFFGLVKRFEKLTVELTPYHDFGKVFKEWDRLIESKEKLNL